MKTDHENQRLAAKLECAILDLSEAIAELDQAAAAIAVANQAAFREDPKRVTWTGPCCFGLGPLRQIA